MGRNILLITTDQMRFDALGCNGGIVARTPVIDALAAASKEEGDVAKKALGALGNLAPGLIAS